ncbi:hypothetical protein [Pseudonocardia xinjiangensis]|uniref:hypothetical protein n=1 Tax=Pseudonocardia xinjiangensis TaxID=75289 RepID=UPI001B7D0226|nr:hypothetical protein [Pseudonocardia xinjiangensis]
MTHLDPGPDTPDRPVAALGELLNAWDPIGVVGGGGPQDEYDCLISPILDRLEGGADAAELAVFLRSELESHFGLSAGSGDTTAIEVVAQGAVTLRARGEGG